MKGVILINAYSDNDDYLYQPARLREEFFNLGVETEILRNDGYRCTVEDNCNLCNFDGYDFCVYLDKDKYILNALARKGIPLFNSYGAITVCDDKMMTYIALADKNIPIPKTLPGLLCYSPEEVIKPRTVDIIEQKLGYPLVIKEAYGSLGKGVYLVHDRGELCHTLEKVKCIPHLLQQFVYTSFGRDLRVIVIGGKVIGGMLRSSQTDFRSNLGAGGGGEAYGVSPRTAELSVKIADTLGLDYCGIDFLFGENDEPVVCEVNSNAYFMGFERCTGINVAEVYARYIIDKVKDIKNS